MKHDLFGKSVSAFPDHALELQTDFSEMLPACFISEGISYLVEVEETGKKLSAAIPGSKFIVMEGCGHWPQFEDHETFNRIHIDFLKNG